jgi:hypothetical protein
VDVPDLPHSLPSEMQRFLAISSSYFGVESMNTANEAGADKHRATDTRGAVGIRERHGRAEIWCG